MVRMEYAETIGTYVNRYGDTSDKCIASDCMMWEELYKVILLEEIIKSSEPEDTKHGYCGLTSNQ